jgi:hypothetical protein
MKAVQVWTDDYRTDPEVFRGLIQPAAFVLENAVPYFLMFGLISGKVISEDAGDVSQFESGQATRYDLPDFLWKMPRRALCQRHKWSYLLRIDPPWSLRRPFKLGETVLHAVRVL